MLRHHFYDEIFGQCFVLIECGSKSEKTKLCSVIESGKPPFTIDVEEQIMICIKSKKDIVHEACHATQLTLNKRGIDNREVFAYYIEWVVNKCNKLITQTNRSK